MTGQYNFRNWKAFGILAPEEKTFGHMMSEAGYATCISGKWQLWSYNPPEFEPEFRGIGQRPEDSGFDEWFLWHARHTEEKGSRYPDPTILDNGELVEDTAGKYGPDLYVDYINGFIERHRDEPFFVYYPMALTHGPFNPPPDSDAWSTADRFKSNPENFGDMVEYMDRMVGRLIDNLERLGLRENTLVIFFGDNGSPRETSSMLGDQRIQGGKGLPTDAGTRAPLIVNWPGAAAAGAVNDDLIDATDIFATIAEVGGGKYPVGKTIDGVSFLPQIKGDAGRPKDVIVVWHDPRPGVGKKDYTSLALFARGKRYKLYDDGRLYDVPNDVLEQSPIPEGAGPPDAEAARAKLRAALDRIPADKHEPAWDPYAQFR
jgi:arylsulfatase A-like enzyme